MIGFQWEVVSYDSKEVEDITGLKTVATQVGESLDRFDILVVPGGFGTDEHSMAVSIDCKQC